MPTILRQNGFRFFIWPKDHLPAHVHIEKGGNEIIIILGNGGELPFVRSNYGMSKREANAVLLITAANNDLFLRQWEEINGTDNNV